MYHKNDAVVLKTRDNSNIEQLGTCMVKLIHQDKDAKCRFFVVPGDGPGLL